MSCKNCGSPFHEIWDCKKPPRDVRVREAIPLPVSNRQPSKAAGDSDAGTANTKSAPNSRKTDRHKPGYQARKQKEYRDRKRLGK